MTIIKQSTMLRDLVMLTVVTTLCLSFSSSFGTTDYEEKAIEYIQLLRDAEYNKAYELFDETMSVTLTPSSLQALWEQLNDAMGGFKKITGTRMETQANYTVVIVNCDFEYSFVGIKVAFDQSGKIAGMFLVQDEGPEFKYKPPGYVDETSFIEKGVKIGKEPWQLDGMLTIPIGDGPFPVVVLLSGSGPNDMDETLGPNKPFKDIAWGLSSMGIATLRFNKRTRQYSQKLIDSVGVITLEHEYIEDARAAIALLRKTSGIDPNKIFLLGHSLGGMVAPRIALRESKLAGVVLVAANARPLTVLIREQNKYILGLDGEISDNEKEQLMELEKIIVQIENLDIEEGEIVYGAGKKYWADINAYDPIKAAKKLSIPILIISCGRDYQITDVEFQLWKSGLGKNKNVVFKVYDNLNHLMIAGSGISTPAEYKIEGHVNEILLKDIADWIRKQ